MRITYYITNEEEDAVITDVCITLCITATSLCKCPRTDNVEMQGAAATG